MDGLLSGLCRLCSSNQPPATATTRPGLVEAIPDVKCALLAPGPAVAAAITGPDEGVLGLKQRLGDLNVPWQQQQPSQQPQHWQQPQPQQPPQTQQPAADQAWGEAISLYDRDLSTGCRNGDPIADCFGVLTYQGGGAVLALADGVSWGERPRAAARAAVYGFLRHIHTEIALKHGGKTISSSAAFKIIQAAIAAAQAQVLAADGTLTTLVAALVAPHRWGGSGSGSKHRSHLLSVAVGDSPAYVWRAGSREVEEVSYQPPLHGFHRDPRVCPGCLGFAIGDAADLSNISYSISSLAEGDVVFLASDGISDNFDPLVRKQASARAAGEGSSRLPGVNALSPATCHTMALAELAGVLKDACRGGGAAGGCLPAAAFPTGSVPQQQQGQQQQEQSSTLDLQLQQGQQQQQDFQIVLAGQEGQQQQHGTTAPLEVVDGRRLTARATVRSLLSFVVAGTAAQRELLEQHSSSRGAAAGAAGNSSGGSGSSKDIDAIADALADMPGKMDHASVVAYRVQGTSSNGSSSSSSRRL